MTEEIQPEKSKAELFSENPERFEDLKNTLLVVKRNEDGNMVVLNQCQTVEESYVVEGYVQEASAAFRGAVRVRDLQTKKIIQPKHGIMNGARNMFRR